MVRFRLEDEGVGGRVMRWVGVTLFWPKETKKGEEELQLCIWLHTHTQIYISKNLKKEEGCRGNSEGQHAYIDEKNA